MWFADEPGTEETLGFARQNWFEPVGREVRMLRSTVGIIDISNFANYEVKGPGAHQWLDSIMANRVPVETGRSCLSPLIGVRGGIAGDFTVMKLDEDDYFVIGSVWLSVITNVSSMKCHCLRARRSILPLIVCVVSISLGRSHVLCCNV